jgi:hypothetical protein
VLVSLNYVFKLQSTTKSAARSTTTGERHQWGGAGISKTNQSLPPSFSFAEEKHVGGDDSERLVDIDMSLFEGGKEKEDKIHDDGSSRASDVKDSEVVDGEATTQASTSEEDSSSDEGGQSRSENGSDVSGGRLMGNGGGD